MILKILIVEDEMAIRDLIGMNLTRAGYQCDYAQNGKEGSILIDYHHYDLILLDIMLPLIDGYELMQYIKPQNIPVIFISAKSTVEERVKGLKMGADDYLVKPFSIDELLARVKTILKRYSINSQNIVTLHDVVFDGDKYEIRYHDQTIHLPLKQFELAFELAKNPNQIFTREQLIEKIWGMDYDGFDRTVDVHIKRIRENLGHLPGFKVVTVRGLGYKIEVEP